MSKNKTITALEIGTGKMQVFVGEIVNGKMLNFIGSGQASAAGVKKADICDVNKAATQAQVAIVMAENSTKNTTIKSVCLGISGTHIQGFRNVGSANVLSADSIVKREDIDRATEDARGKSLPPNRTYIQRICSGYYLDGKYCENPIGKKADYIDVEYWMLHGDVDKIKDALHVVQSFGLEVEHLVFSGIASAYAVTNQQQKNDGVLVIDIGCGTSDYAYIKNGRTVFAGVIPIGGDHITNDMHMGLHIRRKDAERIKKSCAKAIINADELSQEFWNIGDQLIGDKKLPLEAINAIVRCRLEELFTLIREDSHDYIPEDGLKEVVITGGTANLNGICELASGILEVPCSKGKFEESLPKEIKYQEFATAIGLLEYARKEEELNTRKPKSIFEYIFNF